MCCLPVLEIFELSHANGIELDCTVFHIAFLCSLWYNMSNVGIFELLQIFYAAQCATGERKCFKWKSSRLSYTSRQCLPSA